VITLDLGHATYRVSGAGTGQGSTLQSLFWKLKNSDRPALVSKRRPEPQQFSHRVQMRRVKHPCYLSQGSQELHRYDLCRNITRIKQNKWEAAKNFEQFSKKDKKTWPNVNHFSRACWSYF